MLCYAMAEAGCKKWLKVFHSVSSKLRYTFAYTYGVVTNGKQKENYLRAWIYQKKSWKLMLQTLKW